MELLRGYHYEVDPSGCWLWKLSCTTHGYGQIQLKTGKAKAHRLSWQIHKGEIPKGLCVLHKCDVRRCINPEHLWLGTKNDNNQDMMKKGRFWSTYYGNKT